MKNRRDFMKTMATGCVAASVVPLAAHGEKLSESKSIKPQNLTADERANKALAMMQKYGSCCTGVLATYSEELGMDVELAARTGLGMAGGMGGLGHVCGAVSGGAMVVSLKMTDKDNLHDMQSALKTSDTVKKFITKFEEKHGSIQCRKLIGRDISTMEAKKKAMEEKAFVNCPSYVADAAKILEEMFSA